MYGTVQAGNTCNISSLGCRVLCIRATDNKLMVFILALSAGDVSTQRRQQKRVTVLRQTGNSFVAVTYNPPIMTRDTLTSRAEKYEVTRKGVPRGVSRAARTMPPSNSFR